MPIPSAGSHRQVLLAPPLHLFEQQSEFTHRLSGSQNTWRYYGALVLCTALFAATGRFQSLEYGYRIERLEKEKKVALETNRKLQLEEASLGDPTRIDWIARNELGMKTLAPNQIYRAEEEPMPAATANTRPNEPVLTARIQNLR